MIAKKSDNTKKFKLLKFSLLHFINATLSYSKTLKILF